MRYCRAGSVWRKVTIGERVQAKGEEICNLICPSSVIRSGVGGVCHTRWRKKWDWYSASGQLKDMAARTLLLKLHERKLIVLPERKQAPVVRRPWLGPDLLESLLPEPITADLSSLQPFQIQVVGPKQPHYHVFQRYLAQHHYLSFGGPVGENLGYLIRSRTGVDLACLLFGAAAWQCAPRDQWIGWSAEQRAKGLAVDRQP